jgi:hypothetical protein
LKQLAPPSEATSAASEATTLTQKNMKLFGNIDKGVYAHRKKGLWKFLFCPEKNLKALTSFENFSSHLAVGFR